MTPDWPILSITTFLPLAGALLILLFVKGKDDAAGAKQARVIALLTSLLTFVVSLFILKYFDLNETGFQLIERHDWMPQFNIQYLKGVDGVSVWFVIISTFLTPICVLSGWGAIKTRVKEFMVALLVLETMMIGMFSALDFVLFYLFFEGVLIPMFLIVGVWGGKQRVYAAYKFFLYTFLGSLLMLLAIVAMILEVGTSDMTVMMNHAFDPKMQAWLWLAFFASFAVKSPMWPFHTWLPYAHVEAPTAGSVLLAGVLLKMGGYGLLRVNFQMLPQASQDFAMMVLVLSVVAILYTSLVAFVQKDMKKLIAYSSVAHMGYVTLGIFTANTHGIEGAILVMLSHTVVSSALFLCVGVLYDRRHSRMISDYGGVARNMPRFALFYAIFMLASIGLPGTSGFVGEFLSLQGAFAVHQGVAMLAALGSILGAAYMLWLTRQVFFGPLEKAEVAALKDLNAREYAMFLPLVALVVWMGVQPAAFKQYFAPTVQSILTKHQESLNAMPLVLTPVPLHQRTTEGVR